MEERKIDNRRAIRLITGALIGTACGGGGSPTAPPPPPPPPPPGAAFTVSYATYLGGSGVEEIREPILLPDGRLLIGSRTFGGMPTTPGVFQPNYGGGTGDGWLGILTPNGQLDAGTYLGGSGMERPPYGIDLLPGGDIAVVVGSSSPNIPTSAGAYRRNIHNPIPSPGEGFACRLSPDLRSRRWCSYLGGGWPRGGLTVTDDGQIVIAGRITGANFATTPGVVQSTPKGTDDGFLMKLRTDGTGVVFSTRLGGGGSQAGEVILSIREDGVGALAVNGISTSVDFPVTPGAAQTASTGLKDAFFARFAPDASTLVYSTLYGGSSGELAEHRMWLLQNGSTVGVGTTRSSDLPAATGGIAGGLDSFVVQVNAAGTGFDFARYLGGSGDDSLVGPTIDSQGRIYVYGRTTSRDIPVTSDALQRTYGGGVADAVLYILSPTGAIQYATYLGGAGEEIIRGVVIGGDGAVYLVGRTDSDDFPTTPGAFQSSRAGDFDGFVVKLVPGGG
ncbi:MAG: hypothetical protein OEU54_05005 [Gemmatimonadota bacterium]|nr:hypothetical protein [Gemmatimonadota bacterium]